MSSAPPHTAGGGGAGQGLPAVLCWPRPGLSATHSPFIALRWKDPSCATVPPPPRRSPAPLRPRSAAARLPVLSTAAGRGCALYRDTWALSRGSRGNSREFPGGWPRFKCSQLPENSPQTLLVPQPPRGIRCRHSQSRCDDGCTNTQLDSQAHNQTHSWTNSGTHSCTHRVRVGHPHSGLAASPSSFPSTAAPAPLQP